MPAATGPFPHWKAIVAMTPARVIGKDGELPWHLPEDLKFFKQRTTGHAIAMGRTTYESIGRPLPNRRNIVVSTTLPQPPPGCEIVRGIDDLSALEFDSDLFIIGGAKLYEATLPLCAELFVSHVFANHEGDTFFPEFEDSFTMVESVSSHEEFEVRRYRNKGH